MIEYRFTGKVALVTGSSRGMGAAICEAFAKAGATCIVNYFNDAEGVNRRDAEATAEKLRAHGAAVHLYDADVRSYESVEKMMQRIGGEVGKIDVLVNNAGICRDRTLKRISLDEWHSVLETNLDGVFYCCKLALDLLRDGGRIVNIASIAGIVGIHGQVNYASAKAGVIAMTKVLAKELASRQITVNALAPGIIQTPMLGVIKPEVLASYEKQIPIGRVGRPEDVANAVLFFASEETGYITGQTLPVTGGWY